MGDIAVDVLSDPPRVTVDGSLDDAGVRELSNVLRGLMAIGHGEVDVDLAGVTALDPAAVLVFADVGSRGMELHLLHPSPAAQELLHVEAS
jgi:hypothetical protein